MSPFISSCHGSLYPSLQNWSNRELKGTSWLSPFNPDCKIGSTFYTKKNPTDFSWMNGMFCPVSWSTLVKCCLLILVMLVCYHAKCNIVSLKSDEKLL